MATVGYFTATSEDGEVVSDPSEDALYMRVSDLKLPSNSFLTIKPAGAEQGWYIVIALQADGGYEIESRDPRRKEHEVTHESDASKLCRDVMIWLRAAVMSPQHGSE
jgi:hypothetical protein